MIKSRPPHLKQCYTLARCAAVHIIKLYFVSFYNAYYGKWKTILNNALVRQQCIKFRVLLRNNDKVHVVTTKYIKETAYISR